MLQVLRCSYWGNVAVQLYYYCCSFNCGSFSIQRGYCYCL